MNIFSVLSMGNSSINETGMSAMLGYLLSPYQNHGLGDIFLRSFLKLAKDCMKDKNKEIYDSFLKKPNIKAEVSLEVKYKLDNSDKSIDIQVKLLEGHEEKHRIIIENKIKAGAANSEQLQEYYEAVTKDKNDDPFDDTKSKISVIFLTPKSSYNKLIDEYSNLKIDEKSWIYWYSDASEQSTVRSLVKEILQKESVAEISPLNDYLKHTLKAFVVHIDNVMGSRGLYRFGEDIGNIKQSCVISIKNEKYTIIMRDSGQIQLLNSDGDKVVARPLLKEYCKDNGLKITDEKCSTRCYGHTIFKSVKYCTD